MATGKARKTDRLIFSLDAATRAKLDAAIVSHKVKQTTLLRELVTWWVDQPPMLRAMAIRQIGDTDTRDALRLLMKQTPKPRPK